MVTEAMCISWGQVILGGIFSVVGAVGGIAGVERTGLALAAGSALAATGYSALEPLRDPFKACRKPLAYAAVAQRRFD